MLELTGLLIKNIKQHISSEHIKQLIAGDESVFKTVYDHYGDQVYRLAFRFLKDKEQSEEIVQEVFIRLWVNRSQLDEQGNLWLYLYVISKRLCINELRKIYQSAQLYDTLLTAINEGDNQTENDVLASDMERFTTEIINKLPKQQQLIFRLSRIEGLSHKEIANQLKLSQSTVNNHMVAALRTLKTKIHRSDIIYFLALTYFL